MLHLARHCFALLLAAVATAPPIEAGAGGGRLADGISDNSFLIEEAYNQEAGVVQHIATLARQNGAWAASYTDEWPLLSQAHQFSYTVPYAWLGEDDGRAHGFGDVMLNYRYQAIVEDASLPAFAPRVSIILPTGNAARGLGDGATGYQINLPVSKVVSDRVTLHGNAGLTSYFDSDGATPTSTFLGGSVIYAVKRDFNLMLEALHAWDESVSAAGTLERQRTMTIAPGLRTAFNLREGQLVLGVAAPISFEDDTRSYGVFLYGSFEHSFLSPAH